MGFDVFANRLVELRGGEGEAFIGAGGVNAKSASERLGEFDCGLLDFENVFFYFDRRRI